MNAKTLKMILDLPIRQTMALLRFVEPYSEDVTVSIHVDTSLPEGYLSISLKRGEAVYCGGISPEGEINT